MRSNVSSNVLTLNQKTLPTSGGQVRVRYRIPWATKTGGLPSAMAGNVALLVGGEKRKVQGDTYCTYCSRFPVGSVAVMCFMPRHRVACSATATRRRFSFDIPRTNHLHWAL